MPGGKTGGERQPGIAGGAGRSREVICQDSGELDMVPLSGKFVPS